MTGRATHGHTSVSAGRGTPTYRSWLAMRNRCHNPNNEKYPAYGGAGISVCSRWRDSFENFLFDMGSRPGGTTLDRIDGAGNYEPDNCRWATAKQQAENSDNHAKGWRRNNDQCPNGHPYTAENTSIRTDKRTGKTYRRCRTCEREQSNRYREKTK